MFILDWSDTGDCHDHDGVHRDLGPDLQGHLRRPQRRPRRATCRGSANSELVALHRHPNEWFVRQARRVLAERSARGEPLDESAKWHSRRSSRRGHDPVLKLRALWSLYVIGGPTTRFLRRLLDHEHESVRAWAIRLLTDDLPLDSVFSRTDRTGRGPAGRLAGEARGHGSR